MHLGLFTWFFIGYTAGAGVKWSGDCPMAEDCPYPTCPNSAACRYAGCTNTAGTYGYCDTLSSTGPETFSHCVRYYNYYYYDCGCPPDYRIVNDGCVRCLIGETNNADFSACVCKAGYYTGVINSVTTCYECPVGTYTASIGMNTCTACPAGKYSSTKKTTDCTSCGAGTYTSVDGASVCTPCAEGKYSASVGGSSSAVCLSCGTGKYNPSTGGSSNAVCQSCPTGKYGPSSALSVCASCTAGTYAASVGLSVCTPCGAGTASSTIDAQSSAVCQACAAGKYSLAGASECIACGGGKYSGASAGSCTNCGTGKYATASGAASVNICQNCGLGTFAGTAGATTCSNCTVSGTYQPNVGGSNCPACPTGTYQTGVMQAMCVSCSVGTYNGATGRTSVASCLTCSIGKFAGSTQKSVCDNCGAGTYMSKTGASTCDSCVVGTFQTGTGFAVACPNCTSGNFQTASGASRCDLCGAGRYQWNTGQTVCIACTPGTYRATAGGSVCALCSPGWVVNSTNATVCTACAAGKSQSLSGQVTCVTCAKGKYQWRTNASDCLDCEVGKFNGWDASVWDALRAAPNCTGCSVGRYAEVTGSSACSMCGEDRFQNGTNASFCYACTVGWYAGPGQTACSLCAAGKYQVWGVGCFDCLVSTYQPGRGRTYCEQCPNGKYGYDNASTSLSDCAVCSPGKYVLYGMRKCESCEAGTFQTLFSASTCVKCNAGEYMSGVGWPQECPACAPGKYQNSTGATRCFDCAACPAGSFRWRGCNGTLDTAACQGCKTGGVCTGGSVTVRACGETTDLQCGRPETCLSRRYSEFDVPTWLDYFPYQCNAGQYLWGFDSAGPVKTCRQCPEGVAGLNGVLCERCGLLEEPYYLDRTSCVCKAPAVSNLSGVCVCPVGYGYGSDSEECVKCGADLYRDEDGLGPCRSCAAGTTTNGTSGATACEACAFGTFRLAGTVSGSGCSTCPGPNEFAANSSSSVCTKCNTSCVQKGWRWKSVCPSGDASGNYSVCEPCPDSLPAHAQWSNVSMDPTQNARALEECAFECDSGYYYDRSGLPLCTACNTSLVCEAGRKFTACTAWADSHCDEECVDHDKPLVYSHWKSGNNCQWECDAGWNLIVSDYVMFKLYECV